MFYTYRQNNSGGYFHDNAPHYMIVEADSSDEADRIAEENGAYFDGVSKGYDCDCCGDRWSRNWENGTNVPMIYGETIAFDQTVYDPVSYGDSFRSIQIVRKPCGTCGGTGMIGTDPECSVLDFCPACTRDVSA